MKDKLENKDILIIEAGEDAEDVKNIIIGLSYNLDDGGVVVWNEVINKLVATLEALK